jgi:tRNA U55 pseudouridine synthase TruB
MLPRFTGTIMQVPPAFSAIKVNGERAYDIARDGETVVLAARPITINSLVLVSTTDDEAVLEAQCGKGTYVRAIARDLGRALGCFGHVTSLRRTRVGPFSEVDSCQLPELEEGPEAALSLLRPVEAGLLEIPCVVVDRDGAARLRRGQSLLLRGRDAPMGGVAYAACGGVPVAFGEVERGEAGEGRQAVQEARRRAAIEANGKGGRADTLITGRTRALVMAMLTFFIYYNLINVSRNAVASGQWGMVSMLLGLHLPVLTLSWIGLWWRREQTTFGQVLKKLTFLKWGTA